MRTNSSQLFKRSLAFLAGALFFLPHPAPIDAQQAPVAALSKEGLEFFERKIRPVLLTHCYQCHSAQAKRLSGGLRLDTRAGMLKGGASGEPAILPGAPEKSPLIKAIRHTDPKLQMPMGAQLPEHVIRDFETWIKMGAPDPREAENEALTAVNSAPDNPGEARKFWSFQPLKPVAVPVVKNPAWVKTPIDNFVLAKIEEKGLAPAADADKLTLLRRATFDLTGLPPTPREVDDFLRDNAPEAFAKVVDRLLAATAYGEKWGRHWLDLVRYADTAGCNSDFPIPSAYKYRNYVIDAFNRDKPYDQFIREQIAGDLLPSSTEAERREKIVATGYIANSRRFGSRDVDDNLMIDDTIDNLGKAFLGLSVNCARCHDHKFDPIPQRDYYALYGIFKSTRYAFPGTEIYRHPHSLVPLAKGAPAEQLQKYQNEVRDLDLKVEALQVESKFVRGRQREKETAANVLAQKAGQTVKLDQLGRIIADGKLIEEDQDDRNRYAGEASTRTVEEIEAELRKVRLRLSELTNPPNVERAYAVSEGQGADARLHRKGDLKNLGEVAPRGFLRLLGGARLPANHKGSGRRELADWIADAQNPLTARVIVNRIWLHHFGKGIVPTPNDFGVRGLAPTHPELLDHLAAQFIADGWSFKKMHRRMMLSHVYQTASREARPAATKLQSIDANNTYLRRFNQRRLGAEEIRDAMLAVSGALDRTINGAHPFPPERDWRYSQHNPFVATYEHNGRGVYLMQQRIRAHPQLSIFDGADANAAIGERVPSTTPLQALFMMNDPFVHKQADLFAVRVGMAYADDAKRIEYAYRLAFGRQPTAAERASGLAYLRAVHADLNEIDTPDEARTRAALASYLRVLLSSSEFIFVD
ncbi:MAG: PSD1 and planctomycete cytochrome C domain-containing protein [Blastocatellia bacterium]|nr:PSD1 and planctomycete cytochrome C domain-containing protein [Blastocatellia bacterium]